MSESSLSTCAHGADIIDLDRYIRASVRPSNPVHTRERLVVDAGGPDRIPLGGSSTESAGRGAARGERAKRYSHDSGLSDDSYVKRRHRPHRRINDGFKKIRKSSKPEDSKSSVREFKVACEKALRDQQQQIARVAELCEKLIQPQILAQNVEQNITRNFGHNFEPQLAPHLNAEHNTTTNFGKIDQNVSLKTSSQAGKAPQSISDCNQSFDQKSNQITSSNNKTGTNQKVVTRNFGQNVSQSFRRRQRSASESSDVTSSCRGLSLKDKHRTDSCKTYKIIMNKLDELSRHLANRRLPVTSAGVSSGSVMVCDKVVATGDNYHRNSPVVQVVHTAKRRHQASSAAGRNAPRSRGRSDHSVAEDDGWSDCTKGDGRNPQDFDLDDPLHFYAQAKRLQALHATTRTRAPFDKLDHTLNDKLDDTLNDKLDEKLGDKFDEKLDNKLSTSLCGLCRIYWRAVRRYLRQQLFGACS